MATSRFTLRPRRLINNRVEPVCRRCGEAIMPGEEIKLTGAIGGVFHVFDRCPGVRQATNGGLGLGLAPIPPVPMKRRGGCVNFESLFVS